jgi:hypothetical protein
MYEHRPIPCRGVDCQENEKWKVWQDYEKKIINPELIEHIDQSNGKLYTSSERRA